MFKNLFRKKELVEVPSLKYSSEIEAIHHEFESASDNALKEALDILKEAESTSTKKGNRLLKLGFSKAKEASTTSLSLENVKKASVVQEKILYYRRKYPNHKFITKDQVETICEKYGLICGPVDCYLGFVPEKNLQEIEKFKVDNSDKSFAIWSRGKTGVYASEFLNDDGKSASTWTNLYRKEVVYDPMMICAPKKDMDTSKLIGVKYFFEKPKDIPDPVVLQPVKEGFLIITAWGDEAEDPIVKM